MHHDACPNPNHRYHAFYYLLAACTAGSEIAERCGIQAGQSYNYVTAPDASLAVSHRDQFERVDAALAELLKQVTERGAETFWRRLAAILHLGQVQFVGTSGQTANGNECVVLDQKSIPSVKIAAELLADVPFYKGKITEEALKTALENSRNFLGILSPRSLAQAENARNSLARAIYDDTFNDLVNIVNRALQTLAPEGDIPPELLALTKSKPTGGGVGAAPPLRSHHVKKSSGAKPVATIGLLDIFGSEIFEVNSLSQLLINYANDKLQLYFTDIAVRAKAEALYSELKINVNLDQPEVGGLSRQEKLACVIAMVEGESAMDGKNPPWPWTPEPSLLGTLNQTQLYSLSDAARFQGRENPDEAFAFKVFKECSKLYGYLSGAAGNTCVEAYKRSEWVADNESDVSILKIMSAPNLCEWKMAGSEEKQLMKRETAVVAFA